MSDVRSRLESLEARHRLNEAADAALELALRDRLPLSSALDSMLPLLVSHSRARGAWIRTFDEDLNLRDFSYGEVNADLDDLIAATERSGRVQRNTDARLLIAQLVDVAGESFGAAGLCFDRVLPPAETRLAEDLLETWCEELDNYLASIARARQKAQITKALSTALQEPVLDVGVDRAIEILQETVPFEQLVLVYRHEDDLDRDSVSFRVFGATDTDERALAESATDLLRGEATDLLRSMGFDRGREELLIEGVRTKNVVGRFLVRNGGGVFNTYDRDLLELFADFLRQRIVDFNREWRRLSHIFPRDMVRRLLNDEGYATRLQPIVNQSAILFTDISGFTRVSEQVLREPSLVGKLVDTWGEAVVDIVWQTGGVFDKMVGDCVIAFWGPPFFEMSPQECCQRALDAAKQIREYTQSLNTGEIMSELAKVDPPIGVATGLHYGALCVGIFGPDEDYTGFSSDMNNTARLQGVATRDEILCMRPFVEAVGDSTIFGPERQAEVKNVAEPLRFHSVK